MGNLKTPITFPVVWNSETAQDFKELGIDYNEDPIFKDITFYHVDCVFKHEHRGMNCTVLFSGGTEYIVAETIGVVNRELMNRLT